MRTASCRALRAPAVALFCLALVGASACNDDEGGGLSPEVPAPFATDVPEAPAGAYALAWDGVSEPQPVVDEPLPRGYSVETVVTGLSDPVGLAFLPDGRVLVGEQHAGRIRVIEDGALLDEPFATIENVAPRPLELGLIGIAVDPQFAENHWVYAFYVEVDNRDRPQRAVLLRLTERDGLGVEPEEIAVLPATATDKHNGGGLKFGPDGKLYLSIGDTDRAEQADDPSEATGKILRMNRDGSTPPDNPLVNQPDADDRVFAYGFRNLVGFAFHPDLPGRLIATDNGITGFDEINVVRPGGRYGWPHVLAFSDNAAYEDPVWTYLRSIAPAGMEVYTDDVLSEFTGDVFFCQFLGAALHRLRFSEDFQRIDSDTVIATGCATGIAQGPDGLLYFLDLDPDDPDGGRLSRITGPP
ncbi:MAG: PQQ-dependent sugar dehydrogenase [Dehalococcoidia bacterium]